MDINQIAKAFEDATGCTFMDVEEVKAGNLPAACAIALNVKWLRDHIEGQIIQFESMIKDQNCTN